MAIGDYTIPNTTIYLLKGCPLDKDYRHTKYFTNATQQNDYFRTLVFKTFSEQTYQRYAKGQLRIAALADDIYSANYMMFQNTNHGNKWFYAFIDSIEYVSNTVTTVYYTIDVIQTWMFDYSMNGCFVEREHSLTDKFGENLVPENLETGEMLSTLEKPLQRYSYLLCGAIVLKRRPVTVKLGYVGKRSNSDKQFYIISDDEQNLKEYVIEPYSNVTEGSTVWVLAGLPLSYDDYWKIVDSGESYNGFYNVHKTVTETVDGQIVTAELVSTFTTLLNDIATGKCLGQPGMSETDPAKTVLTTEDIAGVYTYPVYFHLTGALENAKEAGCPDCTGLHKWTIAPVNTHGGYIPKNKKLNTYPFTYAGITNGMGDEVILKFEDSNDKNHWITLEGFSLYYSFPAVVVYPSNYKQNYRNFSITQSNYPVPAYTGNAYAEWLRDNRNSWITGTVTSAIGSAINVGNSIASKNVAGAVSGVYNLGANISNTLAKVQDIKQKSPSCSYQAISTLLSQSALELVLKSSVYTLRYEFAEMIDGYFSMFGYATKQVKIPNVKNPDVSSKLRPSWNYIQTKGCMIDAVTHKDSNGNEIVDSCVPADVERELERIYDNGITFWMPGKIVGDYTQDNSPVVT